MSSNNPANITAAASSTIQSTYLFMRQSNVLLGPLSMLLHMSNIIMIIYSRLFHKHVYCILIHLSLSDVFLIIFWLLVYAFQLSPRVLIICITIAYTASILTTVFITIDRYLAVLHCFRYQEMMTKKESLYPRF